MSNSNFFLVRGSLAVYMRHNPSLLPVVALEKLLELYNANKITNTTEAGQIYLQSLLKADSSLVNEFDELKKILSNHSGFNYMRPLSEVFDALLLFRASEAEIFLRLTQVDETLISLWDQLSSRTSLSLTPDDTIRYILKFWDPVKNFVMSISTLMNTARCTIQEAIRTIYTQPAGTYISTVGYSHLKYFMTTELEIQLYEHARARQVMYRDDYHYYLRQSGEDSEILRKIAFFQQSSVYRSTLGLEVDYYMQAAGHPANKSLELLESHKTFTSISKLSKAIALMPIILEQIKTLINSTHVTFDQAVTATFNNTNSTVLSLDYFNKLLPVNTRQNFNALLPVSSSSTASRMRDSADSVNTTYRILPPLEFDSNLNLGRTPNRISTPVMTPSDFRLYEISGITISACVLLLLLFALRPRVITKPVSVVSNLVMGIFSGTRHKQQKLHLTTHDGLEKISPKSGR